MLVSGGTGSGKTTLLNALSACIDPAERVVTIEDAAELRLRQPHVVRLESRPASVEGRGEVTIRDLLRNALRMRPDRIVIGEVRGPEALDLLTALNTGHEGALSTVHANSPEDALRRVETLALMAGVGLPHEAIREQLGRGIDLVVHMARGPGGRRRVVEVGEVAAPPARVGVREVWRRGSSPMPVLLAALAGGLGAVALREAVLATPSAGALGRRDVRAAAPRRARGLRADRARAPAPRSCSARWRCPRRPCVAGPGPAPSSRAAGPAAAAGPSPGAGRATGARSSAAMPAVAIAVADALAAGRSVRAALSAAAGSLEGPAARRDVARASRARARRSDAEALGALCRRLDSPRVDSFAAALLSQQLAGGDLATLLRRFADAAAERDRTEADARSATAQARFTGLLVVAMPAGAALFAELLEPGFVGGLIAEPASATLLVARGGAPGRRVRRHPPPQPGATNRERAARLRRGGPRLRCDLGAHRRARRTYRPLAAETGRAAGLGATRLALGSGVRLGIPRRIERAGLGGRLDLRSVVVAKLGGAVIGGLVALSATPAVPGRLALPTLALMIAAGFLAPDALLERAARRRRERAVAALPDALDMLAVGAASGRDPATGFGEIARATTGPLALELGRAVAEIEAGANAGEALGALRDRVPGPEIGALAAALDRSRSYGSPLAEQLHLQAVALRRDARRRIEERAARAAPKIQLVVALILVPSVLLMIGAAILAHSDALFGQF